jgi:hypothetical protein
MELETSTQKANRALDMIQQILVKDDLPKARHYEAFQRMLLFYFLSICLLP